MVTFLLILLLNWPKLYQETYIKHIVELRTSDDGFCTGMMVKPRTILTVAHCVKKEPTGMAITHFGVPIPFEVKKVSPEWDLALLDCPFLPGKIPIKWATSLPKPAEPVMAIGYMSISEDITMPSQTVGQYIGAAEDFLISSITFHQGFSGGPLINQKGEVLGVNARRNQDRTVGLTVPFTVAKEFVQ